MPLSTRSICESIERERFSVRNVEGLSAIDVQRDKARHQSSDIVHVDVPQRESGSFRNQQRSAIHQSRDVSLNTAVMITLGCHHRQSQRDHREFRARRGVEKDLLG
jgi:hypothetical protein